MKKVVILGSTGSIGENALAVVRALAPRFSILGLSAHRNVGRLLEQAEDFGVPAVAVADPEAARAAARKTPAGTRLLTGEQGLCSLAALPEADIVLCAVVGMAGLRPVLAALEQGTDVALATKEVLVAAGAVVREACRSTGARLIPVDSEHSAIFQCLAGGGGCSRPLRGPESGLKSIILTASGGPFGERRDVDLEAVTPDQALDHPRWDMGHKVTVDSATLMNKGLELMEAHWLFDMPLDRLRVLVHRESIVHSMVEFMDGSIMAQMSLPDMRFAIQYALTFPSRLDGGLPALDLASAGALHFSEPDEERFPCLALARRAGRTGGTLPAVLNAANEIAVEAFLRRGLGFSGIWRVVETVMERHEVRTQPDLEKIFEADTWARREAMQVAEGLSGCRGSSGWQDRQER